MEAPLIEIPVPKEVTKRLNAWYHLFQLYTYLHYSFGIGGVLASTLAAVLPEPTLKTICSVVAGVCMAVIGFVKPEASIRKYITAWRFLTDKVNRYMFGLCTISELLDAMKEGESRFEQFENGNAEVVKSP